jgi:hypothetical protein
MTDDPKDQWLTFNHNGKPIMTFHADGRVTVDESLKPDECAAKVLECIQSLYREQTLRERKING